VKPLVIIPTFNERENLAALVPLVLAVDPQLEILVVDDGSPDGTGELAEELGRTTGRVHALHRPRKLGLGSAYVEGFRWALSKTPAEYVFEMDADFSHDPEEITRFIDKTAAADLVIGSRYLGGVRVLNWPIRRLMLSYFANVYTRIMTGLPLTDATGGFKCYRRAVLEAIDLSSIRSNGYAFQIEMSFKAWKKGFRLLEIPIVFLDRRTGSSKMSKHIIFEAFFMLWKLRFSGLFRSS